MSQTTSKPKSRLNSAFQRLMSVHWWMAGAYLILFIGGKVMSEMPREVSFRGMFYDFHKSIGLLTIALLVWRVFTLMQVWWKKYSKRWPKLTLTWWRNVALHSLMYVLMCGVPISGILLSNSFRAKNVKFFGLLLPDFFPQDQGMIAVAGNLHSASSYAFLALIILHTIAQWKVVRANWRRLINWVKQLRSNPA